MPFGALAAQCFTVEQQAAAIVHIGVRVEVACGWIGASLNSSFGDEGFQFFIGLYHATKHYLRVLPCLQAIEAGDPQYCVTHSAGSSTVLPNVMVLEVVRIALCWTAWYLLSAGKAYGGEQELVALEEVRLDAADGELDGTHDVSKVRRSADAKDKAANSDSFLSEAFERADMDDDGTATAGQLAKGVVGESCDRLQMAVEFPFAGEAAIHRITAVGRVVQLLRRTLPMPDPDPAGLQPCLFQQMGGQSRRHTGDGKGLLAQLLMGDGSHQRAVHTSGIGHAEPGGLRQPGAQLIQQINLAGR